LFTVFYNCRKSSSESRIDIVDSTRETASIKMLAAEFVARPSRFIVVARLDDSVEVKAHLPDPGRLTELLLPGAELRLRPVEPTANRTTLYTVTQVRSSEPPKTWVATESTLANRLARQLIDRDLVRGIGPGWKLRPEARCGKSRFDFLLTRGADERLWIEVKSVTCAHSGIGRFPDAPTSRGRRHIEELIERVRCGDRAMVLFVIPRSDVRYVTPYAAIDPEFALILREARRCGVMLRAARFHLDGNGQATYLGPSAVRPGGKPRPIAATRHKRSDIDV
jgi:sugar fermentation stimulation protein A